MFLSCSKPAARAIPSLNPRYLNNIKRLKIIWSICYLRPLPFTALGFGVPFLFVETFDLEGGEQGKQFGSRQVGDAGIDGPIVARAEELSGEESAARQGGRDAPPKGGEGFRPAEGQTEAGIHQVRSGQFGGFERLLPERQPGVARQCQRCRFAVDPDDPPAPRQQRCRVAPAADAEIDGEPGPRP